MLQESASTFEARDFGLVTHEQALSAQRERALRLAQSSACPHCHGPLSLLDALSVVRGFGYVRRLMVQMPDGGVVLLDERDFNPQTMLLAEDDASP